MNLMKFIFPIVFICSFLSYALGASIAGGSYHSMALKENGAVWAWGNNSHGQLGDGTTEERHTPVQVVDLLEVIAISAGSQHSIALQRDGAVWAWGYNGFGQLGNGTADGMGPGSHPTPELMIGGSGVIDIAGGSIHSLLLKSDGTVWAVGSNRNGQLGDGTTEERHALVQVIGLSDVIAIAGGGERSLALKRDGTVWAWGLKWTNIVAIPEQVIGLSNVIAIACPGYNLALKQDGTVWTWSNNPNGELWDGNILTNSYTPVQIPVSGVMAIEGGENFSIALTTYGTVWFFGVMWLYNPDSYIYSSTPVPVDGVSHVQAIAAGDNHILAAKNDGTIWAWGMNDVGQLGNGTNGFFEFERYPVQVKGFSTDSSDPVINPDVKVNSANGPLTVSAGTPITVTVQISPAYLGLDSDWWIAAYGFGSWFYLVMEDFYPKWIAVSDSTPIQPIYQGPLAPIGPVPIIESEYWLPRGDYEFFFAVDTLMDGLLTLEALHYDSALLTIK